MSDAISETKQSDRAFFGAIERYNSPLNTPITSLCRRVRIPDDPQFVAALNELISRLGFPEFWRETSGGMTPDACAALGSQLFYDYAESDGYCMIGEVKAVALATLPAHLLECNGATYNRVDYPDLYAVLDTAFKPDADHFTVPDLRGITIIGAGLYNPGGINYAVNDLVGARRHTLEVTEIPSHTHTQDAHTHVQNSHNHTQNAHTHVQDAHTHTQNAHTHVQDAHTHTQNSHNHTQNAHNHTQLGHNHGTPAHTHTVTDPGHNHGMNHNHAIQGRSNSAAGANAEFMRSNGTGTDADSTTGLSSLNPTGDATTGITLGTASPTTMDATALIQDATATNIATTAVNQNATATNQNATAVNQNATAVNQSTTATNNAATAVNQNATATNQNTGGGQPHNNMQPSRALKMVIVAR